MITCSPPYLYPLLFLEIKGVLLNEWLYTMSPLLYLTHRGEGGTMREG
jgi:hypothetical protein